MPFALIPLLASIVPEAIKWIAGDSAGKAAEQVASIANQVFGTADPEQAAAAALDPAKALEFKMAVLAAQSASEKEETARMMAQLADVQSARNQTVALAQAKSGLAWGSAIVSVLAVVVFAGFIYMLFARQVMPEGMKDALMLMAGAASAGFTQVLGYWLGSSAGSANKDRLLTGTVRR